MSTMIATGAGPAYEGGPNALSGFGSAPERLPAGRLPRRRFWIECAVAMTVGAAMAVVWMGGGSIDDRAGARRASIERELAALAPALAESARRERVGEGARASAAVALARARPYVELRSLLETLSRQAHSGVTVSRVRQSREGFELQVSAVDSAACASWVQRLARIPGWEGADITDLRLVAAPSERRAERAVQANVRLPSRVAASATAPGRANAGREERARGRER